MQSFFSRSLKVLLRDRLSLYDWMEVDEPVSLIFYGPDGPCGPQISRGLSAIKAISKNRSTWVGAASSIAWFFSRCHELCPNSVELFEASVEDNREVQDLFIKALDIVTDRVDGFDRYWAKPDPDLHRKVSAAIMAVCKVTALLAKPHFRGQDPSKIDNEDQAKLSGGTRKLRDGSFESETFRRIRIASNITVAPRFEDPRVSDRWLMAAAAAGVPDVFLWLVRMGRRTGARSSSILPWNVHMMLVGAPELGRIRAPLLKNKRQRWIKLVIGKSTYCDFELWVNEELKRWYGVDLDHCRKVAAIILSGHDGSSRARTRAADAANELKSYRLFVIDGKPVTYDQLALVFRKVALSAGLVYRPERKTDVLRPVVFHHLRHEYVFARLEEIHGLPDGQQQRERDALAGYMSWSLKEAMLEWYSKHYEQLFGIHRAEEHANRAEQQFVNATTEASVAECELVDQADEEEADEAMEGLSYVRA